MDYFLSRATSSSSILAISYPRTSSAIFKWSTKALDKLRGITSLNANSPLTLHNSESFSLKNLLWNLSLNSLSVITSSMHYLSDCPQKTLAKFWLINPYSLLGLTHKKLKFSQFGAANV